MKKNERTNQTIGIIALCTALLAATGAEALTVTTVSQVSRSTANGAEQISGITYAGKVLGKDLFYAVDDNDNKLYPLTLDINRSSGSLASSGIAIGTGVVMSGGNDLEGCAFDPCSSKVWISQETSALIREFDPETGTLLRSAPVPAIQKKYRGNYSLEALTIAGDGKSMWTANEEALSVDGELATNSVGSVVRLTKFTRTSVRDNWTPNGEWAYETQPIGTLKDSNTRSGVAGLCALPDGNLLVLERRCYDGGFFPDFNIRIYQVNFSGATDVSTLTSLKGASYTKTTKTLLWQYTHANNMPNYEGICLGPRLDDGSCTIVLVSDGGSSAEKGIFTLKCSGLDVRTMAFVGPEGCEPSGYPYRYVNGTSVTATLPSAVSPYYETNLVAHNSWSLSDGRKGEGSSATFAVTNDDSLVWATKTDNALPLIAADSFERITLGTEAGDLPGWSGGGDGWVAAASYSPELPPGYPLQQETHDQVLMVDGEVTRTYDQNLPNGIVIDTMVRATLPTADTPVEDADATDILAFHFDDEGYPVLQHRATLGDTRCRTRLTDSVCTNGQWLRLTIAITNVSNTTWCQVRINGSTCVTSAGALSPTKPGSLGSWHKALSAKTRVSSLLLKGTGAVDDVTLYTPTGKPEFNGTGYVDGVSKKELWDNALPFVATRLDDDFDGDSVSNRRELEKGTDPWDQSDHPTLPTFFGVK